MSNFSTETILPDFTTRTFSLSEFCEVIDRHSSMQSAVIVCAMGYTMKMLVVHLYLVLELRMTRGKTIWIRLERRPPHELSKLKLLGKSQSNDTVRAVLCLILQSQLTCLQ